MYGRILKFVRVLCRVKRTVTELAIVVWFSAPSYPDGDPLLVKINLEDDPPADCHPFIILDQIDPTPVIYELVSCDRDMFMMRIRGIDTVPDS